MMRFYLIDLIVFFFQGCKLAGEINKAASGPTLKEFKEKMNDPQFKEKLHELKQKVENFAAEFPMPGLEDY